MTFLRHYPPAPALRPFVSDIAVFEEPSALAGVALNIVPNGLAEIAVHYGDSCESRVNEAGEVRRAYVYGPHRKAGFFRASGRVGCLCVLFEPRGFFSLFGIPQGELRDRAVELDLLFGGDAARLEEAVAAAGDADAKVEKMEEFLLRRLGRARTRESGIDGPVAELLGSRGCVRVRELSREFGLGEKTLERRFKHDLGLTPKELGRILRFNGLYALLTGSGSFDWRAATEKFGYYDQAHLINDFKDFLRIPPGLFMKDLAKHALFVNRIYSIRPGGG